MLTGPICKHRFKAPYLAALLLLFAAIAQARSVDVVVDNNQAPGKTLYLAVFAAKNGQGSWQQEHHSALKLTLPAESPTTLTLKLPDGQYAMRAYVDMNGNGKLDTASFNRPEEPYAISLAPGRDEPSVRFHNAVFTIGEDRSSVRLGLVYPDGGESQSN